MRSRFLYDRAVLFTFNEGQHGISEEPRMSNPPSLPRRILSKSEAATFLGITERTLSRREAEGVGPPRVKHGRKIVYFEDSLTRWLEGLERKGVRS